MTDETKTQKWYRLNRWSMGITPVQVVKETPQQVVYLSAKYGGGLETRRSNKAGEFFPTFQAAKDYLILRFEREKQSALDALSRAIEKLKKAHLLSEISSGEPGDKQ